MALALENLLGDRIESGLVIVSDGQSLPLDRIQVREARHPLPDERGLEATREVEGLLSGAGERDLVICLLSGGGSALLVHPAGDVSLDDKRATTKALLECGARIHEINAVRKHLSEIKGGRLAARIHPATGIVLVLSDVVGDELDAIASGPAFPDGTTYGDCLKIVARYRLEERLPGSVKRRLERGAAGRAEETPKAGDSIFKRLQHVIVGSNDLTLAAAQKKARGLGHRAFILSGFIEGESREAARMHAAIAREIIRSGNPVRRPACVLSGGETTVTVRGAGLGGRNQEFALAAALAIAGLQGVVVLSGGTDGIDGPTDAAGAIADGATWERARAMGIDPETFLENNDAYRFFSRLGDLVLTGPTLTNVMDLRVMLVG